MMGFFFLEFIVLLFARCCFFLSREGREGEREGEKHQREVASRTPPTGELAGNTGVCPDGELN